MDILANLALGFGVVLTPANLLIALVGCIVGTAVGVLPGLGPTATISLLLPISVYLDRTSSIILMSGIYYGAMYGGSITSILIKIPGEAASVVTCLDGYQMARRGRAGAALGISALASFFAGIVATLGIAWVGPKMASVALMFGPVEKASLLLLGLVLILGVGDGSRTKALAMVGLGLLCGTIGVDLVSGEERFVFDVPHLRDGFGIAIVAMGLFGISEVLLMAEAKEATNEPLSFRPKLSELLPSSAEAAASVWPAARGSALGFFLGLLPGGGAMLASFASYIMERKISRHPEQFGKGAVAGVAGPEAANNAAAQASFIPLLCLGIPANAVIGVIMGALLMAGVTPGPKLISDHPELFWGVIASMFVGNIMLVVLNIPLVGVFVSLLRVPANVLSPLIVVFCVIGAYSLNNAMFDVFAMIGFGFLGYCLRKAGYDVAPFLLAFVIGSMFEQNLRQGLIVGYGDPLVFIRSPISAAFLTFAAALVTFPLIAARIGRALHPQDHDQPSTPKQPTS
jgi:putative tricarboxylic transport membrane protein